MKTGLGFVQGHWKWHHLIDRIRVPIHLPQQVWRYLVSGRYSDLGIGRKSRNVYTPPVFITPAGVTLSEFREVKIFDVDA